MKAMIFAAGRGERMRPLTDICPKPLLTVGGKPLIVWHIERLAQAGITEIVINHAHLGHRIEEKLGHGQQWGVHIEYSPEDEALETAGGIAKALHLLGDQPFLAISSDIFCTADFGRFAARALQWITQGSHAHLMLVDNPEHHPGGDFAILDQARLSRLGAERYTYSGIAAFRTELFAGIRIGDKVPLRTVLDQAILEGKVSGERFGNTWIDVGTPDRLYDLDRAVYRGDFKL